MAFTTDIDDLIRLGHGDVKKLRNIRDTIKHDNFITTVDKKYVESLISTYLRNQSLDETEIKASTSTNLESETKLKSVQSDTDVRGSSLFAGSNNKKFGIYAGIAAVIVLVAVVGFSASTMNQTDVTNSNVQQPSIQQMVINLDESLYNNADIISISGNIKSSDNVSVKLSIENINGEQIWREYVTTKNDGNFSTLLIAAGYGWNDNGIYILKAQHDNKEKKIEFNFKT